MTAEHKLMNDIRVALSDKCVIFRVNVGQAKTFDGRYFSTGVPKGFSDLFGIRKSDGKAVFIEVKTNKGRVSENQKKFIEIMRKNNALADVCRSVEDAKRLIEKGI